MIIRRGITVMHDLTKRFSYKSVFFKYLSSSVLKSIVGIFGGFFTYRYIEPSLLGIWALFTVYEVYATFTRLGIINGLGRELPYLFGQNKVDEANRMASSGLFYALFSNLILLVVMPFLLSEGNIEWDNKNYLIAFIVVLIRLIFSSYASYLAVTFRTKQNFSDLSRINNILTTIRLLTLILVVLFGFVGFLIRELIGSLVEMILLHWKRPLKVQPIFRKYELFQLFKVGFPLFLVSYLTSFIDTIPRLYIIKYGTVEQLGLFSPVMIMLGFALLLPNAISSYMYPKMSYQFGASQDKSKIWKIVLLTSLASLLSGVPIFLGVYFLADYVYLIFPKYAELAPYLKISSFAMLFIGYKSGGLSFAVLKSWMVMFINVLFYLFISILCVVILHHLIDDVLKIATLTMVGCFAFMFFFSLLLSYKVTHKNLIDKGE